jgi:hypothetical protein
VKRTIGSAPAIGRHFVVDQVKPMSKLTRTFLCSAALALAAGVGIMALSNALPFPAKWQERAILVGATLAVPVPIILGVLAAIVQLIRH